MKLLFNPKLFNPLYWHVREALRDEGLRFIYIEGGSSAAKTYSVCQALLLDQYEREYHSLVFRRQHVDIKDGVYKSFRLAAEGLGLLGSYYTFQEDQVKSADDKALIRFRGLDNEENIKGIESFDKVYLNEWNQFTEDQWDQLRKRLRGRKGQQFICDWNPVSEKLWLYEQRIDRDEWTDLPLEVEGCPSSYSALDSEYAFKRINKRGDALWLKVTYRDNYWIVGHPSGQGGLVDEHTLADFEYDRIYKPNLYRVYANGERGITRTGGEFWSQFDEVKHVRALKVEAGATLHVACDQNVHPYLTMSVWQLVGKELRQVHELPCRHPNNNAVKSAGVLMQWLNGIGYSDVLFVYGDPSGNSGNTIDENSMSFYDKLVAELQKAGYAVRRRVGKAHPEVARSADFINDIYEHGLYGYSIVIAEHCKVSRDDYIQVKQSKDGGMLKEKVRDRHTGIVYEPYGHFSDAKRYFITSVLGEEFERYKSRGGKGVYVYGF